MPDFVKLNLSEARSRPALYRHNRKDIYWTLTGGRPGADVDPTSPFEVTPTPVKS